MSFHLAQGDGFGAVLKAKPWLTKPQTPNSETMKTRGPAKAQHPTTPQFRVQGLGFGV